jgi:acetoin utilization protein AcuA
MKHVKRYHSQQLVAGGKRLLVEGPVEPERLASFRLDEGLKAFRIPEEQHTGPWWKLPPCRRDGSSYCPG